MQRVPRPAAAAVLLRATVAEIVATVAAGFAVTVRRRPAPRAAVIPVRTDRTDRTGR
jgi:antitoxin (DNA-binding transcriptional repressor) of toxin-antitoxin stability system